MSPFTYQRPASVGGSPTRRSPYLSDTVSTASPARLVTMLYDRLLVDLDRASAALAAGDHAAASEPLLHAQEVVLELKAGLRPHAWSGGPALDALYTFLHTELVAANIAADPAKVTSARSLVAPLAEAWHDAARQVLETQAEGSGDTVGTSGALTRQAG